MRQPRILSLPCSALHISQDAPLFRPLHTEGITLLVLANQSYLHSPAWHADVEVQVAIPHMTIAQRLDILEGGVILRQALVQSLLYVLHQAVHLLNRHAQVVLVNRT